MTEKTLFVHAGGSKTGSSALQNFCENNASRLEAVGLAYEHRINIKSHYEINSGNGMLLYRTLSCSTTQDFEIDSLVMSYFGFCKSAICSSEYFAEFGAHHWKRLVESSVRLGVKLKVIFYIRNVIPYFLSGYDQIIKCHGGCRSFDEWVVEACWQHGSALRNIMDELPKTSIKVIHFDQVRSSLISSFLDSVGIDPSFAVVQDEQDRQINRSLTEEEREVLKLVNSYLGDAYSQELSNLLIYANPNIRGKPATYKQSTAEFLIEKFSNEVDWINNTFFTGQPVVSVFPKESVKVLHENVMSKSVLNSIIEKQVLEWALEKQKTIKNEAGKQVFNDLKDAGIRNISGEYLPEVPVDFNGFAYLLLNPDVLHAGVNPTQHYIDYGKSEGRTYKIVIRQVSVFDHLIIFISRLSHQFFKNSFFLSGMLTDPVTIVLRKKQINKSTFNKYHEKDDLEVVLEKLKASQYNAFRHIQTKFNVLFYSTQNNLRKNSQDIPVDFDPIAYLLLNPDVIYAFVDPIKHYIAHGKLEGRAYKF
jgi:hypothetical protein